MEIMFRAYGSRVEAPRPKYKLVLKSSASFIHLPLEITHQVVSHLDTPDLAALQTSCKTMRWYIAPLLWEKVHIAVGKDFGPQTGGRGRWMRVRKKDGAQFRHFLENGSIGWCLGFVKVLSVDIHSEECMRVMELVPPRLVRLQQMHVRVSDCMQQAVELVKEYKTPVKLEIRDATWVNGGIERVERLRLMVRRPSDEIRGKVPQSVQRLDLFSVTGTVVPIDAWNLEKLVSGTRLTHLAVHFPVTGPLQCLAFIDNLKLHIANNGLDITPTTLHCTTLDLNSIGSSALLSLHLPLVQHLTLTCNRYSPDQFTITSLQPLLSQHLSSLTLRQFDARTLGTVLNLHGAVDELWLDRIVDTGEMQFSQFQLQVRRLKLDVEYLSPHVQRRRLVELVASLRSGKWGDGVWVNLFRQRHQVYMSEEDGDGYSRLLFGEFCEYYGME